MTSLVVFDYGYGNVRSMVRALENIGADVVLTNDRKASLEADGLVVPGVGAFAACMQGLRDAHGDDIIYERISQSRPVLGVCVGEQVMFDRGDERGSVCEGLGLIQGDITRIDADVVPHMGWNTVQSAEHSQLFDGVASQRFYFVHSFAAHDMTETQSAHHEDVFPQNFEPRFTTTQYGDDTFVAAVEKGPLMVTQFHPEKSGESGAQLLKNWMHSF
ncbi:imidazole glycerol phosphate synthase subunit HisH [Alloscardovia criceti]|uniref:imidazole glycerol phosphate synthase subunit HisH n=1 Tax=Alloscardovia criceti TaxID=356828 RepID=UPI00035D870E|nr:imidazole glycerol phosphate synthase subunit HisH [Alloscardovia criceti]